MVAGTPSVFDGTIHSVALSSRSVSKNVMNLKVIDEETELNRQQGSVNPELPNKNRLLITVTSPK